jgi:hypothetical protein
MLHQFSRPSRIFVGILMIVFSTSVSRIAIGQTNPADGCTNVRPDLTNISAALEVCSQVRNISNGSLAESQAGKNPRGALTDDDRANVQRSAAEAFEQVNQLYLKANDIALLRQLAGKRVIISAILGGIGAGAGGSLHLVNNPHVSHAGTVLGLAAGVLGAGAGLLALVPEHQASIEGRAKLPKYVVSYGKLETGDPAFSGTLGQDPSRSGLLLDMKRDIRALQTLANPTGSGK